MAAGNVDNDNGCIGGFFEKQEMTFTKWFGMGVEENGVVVGGAVGNMRCDEMWCDATGLGAADTDETRTKTSRGRRIRKRTGRQWHTRHRYIARQ